MTTTSHLQDIDLKSPRIQDEIRDSMAKKCLNGSILDSGWCPETWDGILCWPPTAPGQLAELYCPRYIVGFDLQGNATRQCMPNGQWYTSDETNQTWSNYTQCYNTQRVAVLMDVPKGQSNSATLIMPYLPLLKSISTIGYTVSLSTLIVAFCIMVTIKKLRCPRNMLHLNLFVSFMTRALMALLKNVLFVSGLGLASGFVQKNGENFWHTDDAESNWQCRAFTTLWQYSILANYSWILIEGLYLHNLVFFALFTDSNSSITGYVSLGWGLPVLCIIPWAIMRIWFENEYCWTTNSSKLYLIIRIPIALSILINFVFFINIVRVILLKLQSTISEESQRCRYIILARSTLVLAPLFGIHYAVFLGMSHDLGFFGEKVELIWLFADQLFACFQGFFVAVLYCFLNGEVRTEVTRALKTNKWSRLHRSQRTSTRSNSACSCNWKKLRKQRKQKWWSFFLPCFSNEHSMHHRSSHSMASTQQDVATRGCSLASSSVFLDSPGPGTYSTDNHDCNTSEKSPACNRYTTTGHSVFSFCSHMLPEASNTSSFKIMTENEKPQILNRWSDSESCCLALELEDYPHLENS